MNNFYNKLMNNQNLQILITYSQKKRKLEKEEHEK